MSNSNSTVQRDRRRLEDIFVSVTGETAITDRQDQETHKKVIGLAESDSPPGEQQFEAEPVAHGLEDAIGGTGSE